MPTDASIEAIYDRLAIKERLEETIPPGGGAIVWSELSPHRAVPHGLGLAHTLLSYSPTCL